MKKLHLFLRVFSVALAGSTGVILAQGLSPSECLQIQSIYGITPSVCQKPVTAQSVFPQVQTTPALTQLTAPTPEMRQNNIFFSGGGDQLTPEALLQIQQLAELLNGTTLSRACLKLVGHSDSTGSNLVNLEMGTKRATAVRNRLALLLRNPARIEVVHSMGEVSPMTVFPSDSPWQRRVEIWARHCPTG